MYVINITLTGLFHLHNFGVRVINDRLNEVRRSGLRQSVLFHTIAKRKIRASSVNAIPTPNLIFVTETGGP